MTVEAAAVNYIRKVTEMEAAEAERKQFIHDNPCRRPTDTGAPCYTSVGVQECGEPICDNCKAALGYYRLRVSASQRRGRAHATLRMVVGKQCREETAQCNAAHATSR